MRKVYVTISVTLIISWIIAACAQATPKEPTNKLDQVLARGYLVISTDPAYPPQSQLVEGVKRAANTKCSSEQHTANELSGFDIDTAVAIAKELGVEPCFFTPDWTLIVGGNWSDRWDISIGSMTITPERMQKLYFTQPYYTTPAAFFVHKDNTTFTQPSDLAGLKIGGCTGCTYDSYLAGTLKIPGETINNVVNNPNFVGYETDINALQDLALGDGVRLNAVITAQPTGQGAIDSGLPLKQLGFPVFFEYLGGALDKGSTLDPIPLAKKVSEIIQKLHSDGTMLQLSQKYYGMDLTTAAGKFDLSTLNQWK